MDSQLPIRPEASSFVLGATVGGAGGSTLSTMPAGNGDVVYLFDATKIPAGLCAWVGYGMSSSIAQSNAVAAVIGTPSSAFPVAAGTVQAFCLTGGLFFNAVMEAGSSTCQLRVTPGFGV